MSRRSQLFLFSLVNTYISYERATESLMKSSAAALLVLVALGSVVAAEVGQNMHSWVIRIPSLLLSCCFLAVFIRIRKWPWCRPGPYGGCPEHNAALTLPSLSINHDQF